MIPKIITGHIYPPITTRPFDWPAWFEGREGPFDWSAWFEGREEQGPYGYGPTEAEAICNLTENYDIPDKE
jgi:hypothetical protein